MRAPVAVQIRIECDRVQDASGQRGNGLKVDGLVLDLGETLGWSAERKADLARHQVQVPA
ncbi:MAG: hypothetical protein AAGG01_21220 [Planctomycetota bacterium]